MSMLPAPATPALATGNVFEREAHESFLRITAIQIASVAAFARVRG
jgi:hypothetical protein